MFFFLYPFFLLSVVIVSFINWTQYYRRAARQSPVSISVITSGNSLGLFQWPNSEPLCWSKRICTETDTTHSFPSLSNITIRHWSKTLQKIVTYWLSHIHILCTSSTSALCSTYMHVLMCVCESASYHPSLASSSSMFATLFTVKSFGVFAGLFSHFLRYSSHFRWDRW